MASNKTQVGPLGFNELSARPENDFSRLVVPEVARQFKRGQSGAKRPNLMNRILSSCLRAARSKSLWGETSVRSLAAVALICGLSCALMVPQILNFATRDQIERQVCNGLPLWSALERGEYTLLDRRFADRGARKPRSLDSIVIVGIDEASQKMLKQWPFKRGLHAQLIEKLHTAGARVIGLDIGFDAYDPDSERDPRTGQMKFSRDHLALESALKKAGNVVLVSHIDTQFKKSADSATQSNRFAVGTPIDEFDALTPDVAISYVPRDLDGSVRRYPFSYLTPPETEPLGSFAPLCVAVFQNLIHGEDLTRYQSRLRAGKWFDAHGLARNLPLSHGVFPGESKPADRMQTWLTPLLFWGPPGTFATYSYSDVLKVWNEPELKKRFQDRIVFVGATDQLLKDTFSVPAFNGESGDQITPEMPGVEIHATMAAMLLDGAYLKTQTTNSTLWTLLALTLSASVWTTLVCRWTSLAARRAQAWWASRKLPGRVHSPLWIGLCALLGPLPIVAFWLGASWAFSHFNLWIVVIYPALGAALASVATLLLLFGAESSDRRKVLTQMSRLVAPDVMDEILAHPEEDYPRPRRVHATVLFTDLEGFTSYSEAREPEEVVTALNEYFKRMQPIVHAYGGSVDKYIGDSVMAFFGAPVPRPDHAAQALRCAIAMQDECARFRQETGVPFWMRVGVHTGDLIVGGVGSDEQNNYTAIGDTVNLASRLEASNKSFGSRIICSAQTHSRAPDVARVERSQTPIRGKSGDIEILIVRGPLDEPPRDALWGHGDLEIDWKTHLQIDRRIEPDRRLDVDRRRPADRRSGEKRGSARDRRSAAKTENETENALQKSIGE
ncbi:Adenylate cyclase, class 3 [Abditibacterium utsteinense]|uniref:Adenylate cyclase, class 3 n=1 Tax=Abditibacterium utsteinense TaxID=1960156 RepID=A0A2S8SRU9_9BACT|nr:adenylate/guanylate cyclase domain-containing protein [Abditibacterium utsteinense]PQV63534.1 Adenylate cyclase, class 3 [Abditibacterium utsteinense]